MKLTLGSLCSLSYLLLESHVEAFLPVGLPQRPLMKQAIPSFTVRITSSSVFLTRCYFGATLPHAGEETAWMPMG